MFWQKESPWWHSHTFLVTFLVLVIWGTRVPALTNSITESHTFAQSDTFVMAQRFMRGESSFFAPKLYHAQDPGNTERVFLAAFPLYQGIVASFLGIFGQHVVIARLVSLFMFSVATVALYFIGERLFGKHAGFLGALLFTLFPASYFWSRAITPDIFALALYCISVALLMRMKLGQTRLLYLSGTFFALATLVKPLYLAFGVLNALYIFQLLKNNRWKILNSFSIEEYIQLLLRYFLLPLTVLVLWRGWIATFSNSVKSVPSLTELMHGGVGYFALWGETQWPLTLFTQKILYSLLTPLGGVLFLAGFITFHKKTRRLSQFFGMWFVICLFLSLFLSAGSAMYEYYLLPWLPLAALLGGHSIALIWDTAYKYWQDKATTIEKTILLPISVLIFIFIGYMTAMQWTHQFSSYFAPSAMNQYEDAYETDYLAVRDIIEPNDKLVTITDIYSPYILNRLEREGVVYPISSDDQCPLAQDVFANLSMIYRSESKQFLLLDTQDTEKSRCTRSVIDGYLRSRYPVVYDGERLLVYEVDEPRLILSGDSIQIELTIESLGNATVLEVGGLPGATGPTIIEPTWQELPDGRLHTIIENTADWVSFKIYWESPEIVIENPAWRAAEDGWVLRRF